MARQRHRRVLQHSNNCVLAWALPHNKINNSLSSTHTANNWLLRPSQSPLPRTVAYTHRQHHHHSAFDDTLPPPLCISRAVKSLSTCNLLLLHCTHLRTAAHTTQHGSDTFGAGDREGMLNRTPSSPPSHCTTLPAHTPRHISHFNAKITR
jgi:hypothetical protein